MSVNPDNMVGRVTWTKMSSDVLVPIQQIAASMVERKTTYDLCLGEAPAVISNLAQRMSARMSQPLNTAILKRYSNREAHISGAYSPHMDPAKFSGKIAIGSLDGLAYQFFQLKDRIYAIKCTPGKIAIADSTMIHWVTPPLEAAETRHMLFLGYDGSLQ